jgi:aryl-alcohol dehydrogenase-like predicted oxidoreductase
MVNLKLALGVMSFSGPDVMGQVLEAAKGAGISQIDTAEMYGDGSNESDLGAAGAAAMGFSISTKNIGGWNNGVSLKPENLLRSTKESMEKLKVDQLDVLYIHGPG